MGRMSLLAVRAARLALEQSGLPTRDLAVVVGSGTGEIETHREVVRRVDRGGRVRVLPTTIPRIMASTVSANLATVLKTRGPSLSVTAACAGGAYNLAIAASWIRDGVVDHALAGGVEAEDVHFHLGFDSMRAYTRVDNHRPEWASRPYAADRAGFIFGEGAGILALESRESAERRGAEILGSLRGFGMSSDGSGEMVAPDSEGAELAIRRALRHSGVPREAIGYINTHGTSTPLGDISEVRAIRRVFDDALVPYGSTKGYTGHTVSAAGALEAAFTLLMLREGWLSPSLNAEPLDPELENYPPVRPPHRHRRRMGPLELLRLRRHEHRARPPPRTLATPVFTPAPVARRLGTLGSSPGGARQTGIAAKGRETPIPNHEEARGRPGAPVFRPASRPKAAKLPSSTAKKRGDGLERRPLVGTARRRRADGVRPSCTDGARQRAATGRTGHQPLVGIARERRTSADDAAPGQRRYRKPS